MTSGEPLPSSAPPLSARMERVLQEARASIYERPGPAVADLIALLAELDAAAAPRTPELEAGGARACELLAIGHRLLGNFEAGLRASDQAQRRYAILGDEAGVAKACLQAGNLHWALGAFEPALQLYERALAVRRRLGDRRGEAGALGSIGVVLDELGRLDEARRCYEESLAISRELADRMFEGRTLNNLGETCLKLGDHATALTHCRAALGIFRERAERAEEANALNNLGRIGLAMGDPTATHAALTAALAVAEEVGERRAQADAHFFLGRLQAVAGTSYFSLPAARAALERALAEARALEMRALEAEICAELATVLERAGDPQAALQRHREFHAVQREVFNERAEQRVRHLQVERALERARDETRQAQDQAEALGRLNRELDDQKRQLDAAVVRLLRLDREKSDLLGMAAHDIRNPLAAIMSLVELWQDDHGAGASGPTIDTMRTIYQTAQSSFELVTRLLDVNAIESGRRTAIPILVDVGIILQTVAGDYRARAAEKTITLECHVPPGGESPTVVTDPLSLRQILDNLVSNAVKYTPRGGRVTLAAERDGARVALTVTDTGPGFTPDDRIRLFRPFARLSARPTDGEHSSGLGLYLVQRLVSELGGELSCESEPGAGARMRVSLPAAN